MLSWTCNLPVGRQDPSRPITDRLSNSSEVRASPSNQRFEKCHFGSVLDCCRESPKAPVVSFEMPKESGKHHNWSFAPNRKSITFLASSLVVAKLHTTQSPGQILIRQNSCSRSFSLFGSCGLSGLGFRTASYLYAWQRLYGVITGAGLSWGGRWMTGGRPPRQHLASSKVA